MVFKIDGSRLRFCTSRSVLESWRNREKGKELKNEMSVVLVR